MLPAHQVAVSLNKPPTGPARLVQDRQGGLVEGPPAGRGAAARRRPEGGAHHASGAQAAAEGELCAQGRVRTGTMASNYRVISPISVAFWRENWIK